MLRHAKTISTIVAGGLAGTVAALILSRAPIGQVQPGVPVPSAAPTVVYLPQLFEPARPLAESSAHTDGGPQGSQPGAIQPVAAPPSEREFADDRRITTARHARAIEDHGREPVDIKWARRTESAFRSDLTKLGEAHGFSVVSIDCRTTTCASTLEWPEYGKAVGGWRDIVVARYESNCGKDIVLPEPDDPSHPYRATVVFDCEVARTEGR